MQSDRIQQLNQCGLPSSSPDSFLRDFSVMWPSVLSPLYTENSFRRNIAKRSYFLDKWVEHNILQYNVPDLCVKTTFVTYASFPFQGGGDNYNLLVCFRKTFIYVLLTSP